MSSFLLTARPVRCSVETDSAWCTGLLLHEQDDGWSNTRAITLARVNPGQELRPGDVPLMGHGTPDTGGGAAALGDAFAAPDAWLDPTSVDVVDHPRVWISSRLKQCAIVYT